MYRKVLLSIIQIIILFLTLFIINTLVQIAAHAREIGKEAYTGNLGGSGDDVFEDVKATADGGYIIVGDSNSTDSMYWGCNGSYDGIIIKFNQENKIEWSQNFGGSGDDSFRMVACTTDNGYIAVGHSDSADTTYHNTGQYDAIIVKYDANGVEQWSKSVGTQYDDFFSAVTIDNMGNILVAGNFGTQQRESSSMNPVLYNTNIRIFKYDNNGDILMQRDYREFDYERISNIVVEKDNSYITVGGAEIADENLEQQVDCPPVITKYDANGNILWKIVKYGQYGNFLDVLVTEDDNYMVVGIANAPTVAKYDAQGNTVWSSFLPQDEQDAAENGQNINLNTYTSIVSKEDGNYIVSAHQHGTLSSATSEILEQGEGSAMLLEYSAEGNLLGSKRYGEATLYASDVFHGESFSRIVRLNDDEFLTVGTSESANSALWGNKGGFDGILVRVKEVSLQIVDNEQASLQNPATGDSDHYIDVLLPIMTILSMILLLFLKKNKYSTKVRKNK